jgi:hypothetical protein
VSKTGDVGWRLSEDAPLEEKVRALSERCRITDEILNDAILRGKVNPDHPLWPRLEVLRARSIA